MGRGSDQPRADGVGGTNQGGDYGLSSRRRPDAAACFDMRVHLSENGVLLDVREDGLHPGAPALVLSSRPGIILDVHVLAGRKDLAGVMVVVKGQANLLEVVGALQTCGRLANLLDRGDKQGDQD